MVALVGDGGPGYQVVSPYVASPHPPAVLCRSDARRSGEVVKGWKFLLEILPITDDPKKKEYSYAGGKRGTKI